MGNSSLSINLLKKSNKNFFDIFIKWALTVGRIVIILVEIIALSAFIYRFSLDRQLVDTHDQIKQRQAILTILKDNETTYRSLQERILLSSQLAKKSNKSVDTFQNIIEKTPSGFLLSSISLSGEKIKMEGKASSIRTVTKFIDILKAEDQIISVSLDQVESKPSGALIAITITVTLKKTQ